MTLRAKKPKIWVLHDNRPGNNNQASSLARALGYSYEIKKVSYNRFIKLPNFIKGASLIGVDMAGTDSLDDLDTPSIIISAGRRLASVALYLKEKYRAFAVSIMNPCVAEGKFDLVLRPSHDSNIRKTDILTIGSLYEFNGSEIKRAAELVEQDLPIPGPYLTLLVGGDNKQGKFTANHAVQLAELASKFADKYKLRLLVTTSRRTSDEAAEALRLNLSVPNVFYNYSQAGENPYKGFLGLAEALIVTGDSVSMCTEAASSGKPLYIFDAYKDENSKFQRFHEQLYKANAAEPLTEYSSFRPMKKLDEVHRIAAEVRTAIEHKLCN